MSAVWWRGAAVAVGVIVLGAALAPPAGASVGPAAGFSDSSPSVGQVFVNGLGHAASTLTNTGSTDLHVVSVSVEGASFPTAAVTTDCTKAPVPPNGTCTIDVYASPPDEGDMAFSVRVTDDAPDSPQTLHASATGLIGYETVASFGATSGAYATAPDRQPSELTAPTVGIAAAPDGKGGWTAGSDGNVYASSPALDFGSMRGTRLNAPVVGMAGRAFHVGAGYWLAASDGGLFAFNAPFLGSMGGKPLNQPIVGMASTPTGNGYWLVASDGGVFSFGDAGFFGSMGGKPLNQPMVGMAPTRSGHGYWLFARDGGVFSFGDALFHGSAVGLAKSAAVGGFTWPAGSGYGMTDTMGDLFFFGSAHEVATLRHPGSGVVAITGTSPLRSLLEGWLGSG